VYPDRDKLLYLHYKYLQIIVFIIIVLN